MPPDDPHPPPHAVPALVRRWLRVQGIVQGVGFRPFVARLATSLGLTGFVENTTRGVEIEVQGPAGGVATLGDRIESDPPPMARVFAVESRPLPLRPGEATFAIRASRSDPVAAAVIPPDIALCDACLGELNNPGDRRAGYPFINCTDCGPRYTIIDAVPYDRARTSMAGFPMCPACAAEYADPASRRFHAQPNACPACGPRLAALDPDGAPLAGAPLGHAVAVLRDGGSVALLGLGGFHLACDAGDDAAVCRLRARKQRPRKPFAVMLPDLDAARRVAHLDAATEHLLRAPQAPIVLAPARREGAAIAPSVAPGQDRLGLFLPYTPLHHLLFRAGGFQALVMTSGNRSDEPILATWDEARSKLRGVVDLFVVHDRPIRHRVDDSVVKPLRPGVSIAVRRARGYAPAPVPLRNPRRRVILALGAELGSTYGVVRGDWAFLGPHVGDLKGLEVEGAYRQGVDHLLALLRATPDLVVCDQHPGYRSTRYGEELAQRGLELLRVQHHEAHAAACMAEHGYQGEALALTLDGLGYGPGGELWGGEILAGQPGGFRRVGRLRPVPQPGGDRAAREPWRMAASYLREVHGPAWRELPLPALREHPAVDLGVVETALARGINAPPSSSCGRLFDAAAALLGFRGPMRYSAQAPMELEALAAGCREPAPGYPSDPPQRHAGLVEVDPRGLVAALLEDVLSGRPRPQAALAFHRGLAAALAWGVSEAARDTGLRDVFLSGGCLQNAVFERHLVAELQERGLRPHGHREVPPNDGGIAFGQAAWAAAAG